MTIFCCNIFAHSDSFLLPYIQTFGYQPTSHSFQVKGREALEAEAFLGSRAKKMELLSYVETENDKKDNKSYISSLVGAKPKISSAGLTAKWAKNSIGLQKSISVSAGKINTIELGPSHVIPPVAKRKDPPSPDRRIPTSPQAGPEAHHRARDTPDTESSFSNKKVCPLPSAALLGVSPGVTSRPSVLRTAHSTVVAATIPFSDQGVVPRPSTSLENTQQASAFANNRGKNSPLEASRGGEPPLSNVQSARRVRGTRSRKPKFANDLEASLTAVDVFDFEVHNEVLDARIQKKRKAVTTSGGFPEIDEGAPRQRKRTPRATTPSGDVETEAGESNLTKVKSAKKTKKSSCKKTPKAATTVSNNFVRTNLKAKWKGRRPGQTRGGKVKMYNGKPWLSRHMWKAQQAKERNEALYSDLLDEKELDRVVNDVSSDDSTDEEARELAKFGEASVFRHRGDKKAMDLSGGSADEEDPDVVGFASSVTASFFSDVSTGMDMVQNNIRSSSHVIAQRRKKTAKSHVEAPEVVHLREQGENADIHDVLKHVFHHDGFLELQEETIHRVVSGKSTLLVLPTGGGKSLCYQLPAFVLPGITLVVTPLISLMEDQLNGLPPCLKGAIWNSTRSTEDVRKLMDELKRGEIKILFVSPEKLLSAGFQRFMTRLPHPGVTFACIDEAHCVSQWSHNFRPTYMRLAGALCGTLNVRCILALTATATRQTELSVCQSLKLDPESQVVRVSPHRRNLHLTASRDHDRNTAIVKLLQSQRFTKLQSIIVYTTTRRTADEVAILLNSNGIRSESYHSGKNSRRRKATQTRFMNNELRVVVATIAFGMGIDKRDVRAVIHYNAPRSFEHYVQEIGRAGRDGLPAFCHVFYQSQDIHYIKRLVEASFVDESSVNHFVNCVFNHDSPKGMDQLGSRHRRKKDVETRPVEQFEYVSLNLADLQEHMELNEMVAETLLCHLEICAAKHVQIIGTLHTTARIGFHKVNAEKLAPTNRYVQAIIDICSRNKSRDSSTGYYRVDVTAVSLHGLHLFPRLSQLCFLSNTCSPCSG